MLVLTNTDLLQSFCLFETKLAELASVLADLFSQEPAFHEKSVLKMAWLVYPQPNRCPSAILGQTKTQQKPPCVAENPGAPVVTAALGAVTLKLEERLQQIPGTATKLSEERSVRNS